MKYLFLSLLAANLVLTSCQNNSTQSTNKTTADSSEMNGQSPSDSIKQENPDPAHNSQNALDWDGEYEGTIPCADCEGIKTSLIIHMDKTFTKKMEYLGKGSNAFNEEGTFTWDDSGSIITLKLKDGVEKYKVGEGRIWMLDQEGNVITGNLADHYILKKL